MIEIQSDIFQKYNVSGMFLLVLGTIEPIQVLHHASLTFDTKVNVTVSSDACVRLPQHVMVVLMTNQLISAPELFGCCAVKLKRAACIFGNTTYVITDPFTVV